MEDIWNSQNEESKNINKKKIVILILMIIFIIFSIVMISLYIAQEEFRNWVDKNVLGKEITTNEANVININADENMQVYAFHKNIVTLNKNVMNIYNDTGNSEAELDIKINNAIFDANDRFLGIAENERTKSIFNRRKSSAMGK